MVLQGILSKPTRLLRIVRCPTDSRWLLIRSDNLLSMILMPLRAVAGLTTVFQPQASLVCIIHPPSFSQMPRFSSPAQTPTSTSILPLSSLPPTKPKSSTLLTFHPAPGLFLPVYRAPLLTVVTTLISPFLPRLILVLRMMLLPTRRWSSFVLDGQHML